MENVADIISAINIAGVIAALAAWRKASIASRELTHNHGGSVKDAVSRIEAEQEKQAVKVNAIQHEIDNIVRLLS